ncbi:serine hydroxymethyltransferase [Candidatus Dependentiae bacterium]|nr:MAG: serine hydroxymethyltransferase [Candidatus Dependentiae bacterium]
MTTKHTSIKDHEIESLIQQEIQREETTINLIASENYASTEVLKVLGSVLTNKYAEGYPGKRYYAGCTIVDHVEKLAIERCKKLFGADHINVQPHSGSQANMAVYMTALKPDDTVLGMGLAEGGHMTHGHPKNFSSIYYNAIQYGVDRETEQLNYNAIAELAHKHKPKLIIAGASAYSRSIDFAQFAKIAKEVGAFFLADIAHIAGLVAAGFHPSPIEYADFVTSTTHKTLRGPRGGLTMCKNSYAADLDKAVMPGIQGGPFMHVIAAKAVCFLEALQPSFKEYQQQIIANAKAMAHAFQDLGYRIVSGGTDNHLFIVDVRSKNITGRQAEHALEKAGITVSRSCIPFDSQKPWVTSGIRIGTPAITTRGMKEKEVIEIAQLIDDVLAYAEDEKYLEKIRRKILDFCKRYLLYQ